MYEQYLLPSLGMQNRKKRQKTLLRTSFLTVLPFMSCCPELGTREAEKAGIRIMVIGSTYNDPSSGAG